MVDLLEAPVLTASRLGVSGFRPVAPVYGGSARLGALRVVVVDEYEVVRTGLVAALSTEADMVVAGAAASGTQALELARARRADVVVVGPSVTDMSSTALCRRLRAHVTATVVQLTASPDASVGRAAGPVRAHACVAIAAGLAELKRVVRFAHRARTADEDETGPVTDDPAEDAQALTPQQQAVARLAVRGMTNREIGAQLFISESTVRFHLQNLKQRLGARNKVEVITRVLQDGLLECDVAG